MVRSTPTRPPRALGIRDAAEAVFKPPAKAPEPAAKPVVIPGAREARVVAPRPGRARAHFQEAGPGWQERINQALRLAVGLQPQDTL